MNSKLILLLFFSFILFIPSIPAGFVTIEVDLETSYDGDVTPTTIDATSIDLYAVGKSVGLAYQWIFLEFDISGIPDQSTVEAVNITYNVTSASGFNWQDRWKIFGLSAQPSVSNAATLWPSITSKYLEVYHETEGLKIRDLWTIAETDLQTALQSGIDWFGLAMYGSWVSGDWVQVHIQSSEAGDVIPTLGITFSPEAPYCHTPTPTSGAVEQEPETNLTIHVTNPNPWNYTLTWQWLDGDTWKNFSTNSSTDDDYFWVGTYSYYAQFLNATRPGETYYWRVYIEDDSGNWSLSDTYFFTVSGVAPPSGASCSRHNETAINISFTKAVDDDINCTTICYYQLGYDPPGWEEGTFGFNTTESYYIVDDLEEGECYSFSLWSNFNESGNWTLSDTKTYVRPCCTGGGEYNICFRYENESYDAATDTWTNAYINFSDYPCSDHLLTIHYDNAPNDYRIINETWYLNNDNSSCISINTSEEPLYFEFAWNWTVNTTCSNCSFAPRYSRFLTPYAARNIDGNETITFYMITNRNVVGEYYGYNYSGNCTLIEETTLNDNLIRYEFNFEDRTHLFDTYVGTKTYSSFYRRNNTNEKIIVHQEYWDAQQHVHPVLLFEPIKYFVGVNNSDVSDGYKYEKVGIAPNYEWWYGNDVRTIYINKVEERFNYLGKYFDLTYGWDGDGLGMYVLYEIDPSSNVTTTALSCNIYGFDDDETPEFTNDEYDSNEYLFHFPTANETRSYHIFLDITVETEDDPIEQKTISVNWWILSNESAASIADTINTTLYAIFGQLPYRIDEGENTQYMNYNNIIIGGFMILTLSFGALVGLGAAMMLTGLSTIYISGVIYGGSVISTIFPYAGIFIIFMGILVWFSGRSQG